MALKPGFDRKTAKKFAVVHRPHDDPRFHDAEASEHVLVPLEDRKSQKKSSSKARSPFAQGQGRSEKDLKKSAAHEHIGEAALYGIGFDDSKYDYTQHLKPVGLDPQNAVFIPAKSTTQPKSRELKAEDLFAELEVQEPQDKKNESMFERGGTAKREYLKHQQDVDEELRGFRPDLNPALREVLEALEDDAYVVNKDIAVKKTKADAEETTEGGADDDDLFEQLLLGGEVEDAEDFDQEFDEWDVDNLQDYEEEHYRDELQQFDNIENFEDLQNIDYQADVTRFKQQQSRKGRGESHEVGGDDQDSLNEFGNDSDAGSSVALPEENGEEEEDDFVGELPQISTKKKTTKSTSKSRRKKGTMSDVSGFSMSSSAIARSEALTVLDDRHDQIIAGYENYEEEQEQEEEDYQPFNMANERADFESMLDDFLENYELESGGRKLVKKNHEAARLKQAADEVSKGKLSQRRNKQRQGNTGVDSITGNLKSLRF
ncbi:LAME_0D07470g1_1 [Lachancea meyersii CBS 8951]|uniref:LAME_0D07470g1_1 n=1 Tax=Lachancea meyersii CBS 8951 TaxID=1266667 RepID=A0A1G4JA01_9SACH|nr:LAME_0D07470g1_1 [Lachancea meyersii CBS 8951]